VVKVGLQILAVPVLKDNYVWLMHDSMSAQTVVIDPAVAQPVLDAAREHGWIITQIWNTHWHGDHVGGNAEIKAATRCLIVGPAAEAEKIGTLDVSVGEGDTVSIGSHVAHVLSVPAHTAGHIAYHLPQAKVVFVGDTLFAMGCGRLFEGTAAQMFDNMQRLACLEEDTVVYCAHEYTASNGAFAAAMAPDDEAIAMRLEWVTEARERGEPTVPTTIGLERATNLFMRAQTAEELARLRSAKDSF
jgi:hydroxyacylglutathione hydrolase